MIFLVDSSSLDANYVLCVSVLLVNFISSSVTNQKRTYCGKTSCSKLSAALLAGTVHSAALDATVIR